MSTTTIIRYHTTPTGMISKKADQASANRTAYTKYLICVILLISVVTLLLKSFVHRDVLITPGQDIITPIRSLITSNGTEYKLTCELSEPKALDAIARVASDECKIKLANAACKNAKGKLTPREIVSQCPRGRYVPYRLVGCFLMKRMTLEDKVESFPHNTPKVCVDYCTQRYFRYAMVQNGNACYCDDDEPSEIKRLGSKKCNEPCGGNPTLFCGGDFVASVYETGIAKHPQQPIKLYPSANDKPVRIAFLLMFHKRNLRQVRRLLRNIYHRNHYYYIHIDPKQHYLFREMVKLEKEFPNIHVTRQRHAVNWGCFSQLQALLTSFKNMLSIPTWNPDYILNLSESDFPVKTIAKLTEFLSANPGRNFFLVQGVKTIDQYITVAGYDKQFVECANRMWLIGDRQVPNGMVTHGGSDWFCLSREFIQYALDTREDLVVDLLAVMEHTVHSTENFFAQLLLNSRFCQTWYNSNMRLISWQNGKGCKEKGTVEWRGCSPVTIRREQFPGFQRSITEDIYAVRKFNPIFDQAIILMVEEYAYGKYPSGVPNINAYWQSVYHNEDEIHEKRMSAVLNAAYVLLYINAREHKLDRYEVVKILEITHYFNRNEFEGFLIRHVALLNDHRLELEVFVKPKNKFKPVKQTEEGPITDQLTNFQLQVSNTIDVVENLPIDFDRVLTLDKTPAVVLRLPKYETLAKTINHTVSVEWINPLQQSIAMEKFPIMHDPSNEEHHILESLLLKPPLASGIWHAKVSINESFVGSVDFLMVDTRPILQNRFSISTNACVRPHGLLALESETCILSNADFVLREHFTFSANVAQMYQLQSTCIANGEQFLAQPFVRCTDAMWSSFAPDPKSDINYRLKKVVRVDY